MTFQNIKNKLTLTKIIYSVLITVVLVEAVGFTYLYYSQSTSQKALKEEVRILKEGNAVLSKMATDYTEINGVDRIGVTRKYVRPIKRKLGAEIVRADIISKISKKGHNDVYYRIKLKYMADSLISLRKLIALLYLDDDIVAITNVKQQYIEAVIKKKQINSTSKVKVRTISSKGSK